MTTSTSSDTRSRAAKALAEIERQFPESERMERQRRKLEEAGVSMFIHNLEKFARVDPDEAKKLAERVASGDWPALMAQAYMARCLFRTMGVL